MAISQQQTPIDSGKKAKLYPTIILCILAGAAFCLPYGLMGVVIFFPPFIIYLIYQLVMLFFREKSMRVWRMKKIVLWSATFAIGFAVQYAMRMAYESKGNEFIQAIEVYHEQNGRFPSVEDAHEIGNTLGVWVGTGKAASYKFYYSLPNTANPAMDNNEINFPYIFFQSPNIVFETCFFNAKGRKWDCTE